MQTRLQQLQQLMKATKQRRSVCTALKPSSKAGSAMAAANDYHDALAARSALPSHLQSVSDRRGAQLVDIALPSFQRRENTHIACHSHISTEIAQAHPNEEVHKQNARRPTHTSCKQACSHDGLCRKCGVYQNLKAFRRTKGCRIDVCRSCELSNA